MRFYIHIITTNTKINHVYIYTNFETYSYICVYMNLYMYIYISISSHLHNRKPLTYLFISYLKDREIYRQKARDNTSTDSLPKGLQQLMLGLDKVKSPEINPGLTCRWQKPNFLSHHCCPQGVL